MRARSTIWGLSFLVMATGLLSCGDDSTESKAPRIPAAVADRLAGLSDETADALEAGDDCAAQDAADELERETLKAESQIPAELRPEVTAGVQQLTASIECEPEPVITTVPETTTEEKPDCPKDEEHGNGKEDEGDGKGSGNVGPPGLEKKEDEKKEDEEKGKDECEDREGGEGNGGDEGEGGE